MVPVPPAEVMAARTYSSRAIAISKTAYATAVFTQAGLMLWLMPESTTKREKLFLTYKKLAGFNFFSSIHFLGRKVSETIINAPGIITARSFVLSRLIT
jgi:hypothetical protein